MWLSSVYLCYAMFYFTKDCFDGWPQSEWELLVSHRISQIKCWSDHNWEVGHCVVCFTQWMQVRQIQRRQENLCRTCFCWMGSFWMPYFLPTMLQNLQNNFLTKQTQLTLHGHTLVSYLMCIGEEHCTDMLWPLIWPASGWNIEQTDILRPLIQCASKRNMLWLLVVIEIV